MPTGSFLISVEHAIEQGEAHMIDDEAAAVWPPYPEATDPRNRDLYARHGYQVREPFALPDGALFWPMWRPGTH